MQGEGNRCCSCKITFCNEQISVPNSKRNVKTENMYVGTSWKISLFLSPLSLVVFLPTIVVIFFDFFTIWLCEKHFFHFKTTFGCWIPRRFVSISSLKGTHKANINLATPGHSIMPFHYKTWSAVMFSGNITRNSCQWDCAWSQGMKQLKENTTCKIHHF